MSVCERTNNERVYNIVSQWAEAIRLDARVAAANGSCFSILLSASLPKDEGLETVHIASSPCAVAEPDNLVELKIDELDFMPAAHELADMLVLEVAPFVIGVGRVAFDRGLKKLVLRRVRDVGQVADCREITPEMIEAGTRELVLSEPTDPSRSVVMAIYRAMTAVFQPTRR